MQHEAQQSSSSKEASKGRFASTRGMTPYLIAAFLAAGSMAWYFFVFVPAQLEYFVGLRFRTLAVASGQIRSKIENLEKALDGAGAGVRKDHSAKKAAFSEKEREQVKSYLRLLVPEIQLDEGDHSPSGFALSAAGNPDLAATVAWESVVDQARAASLQDFEDLILASPEGKVVWQREKTTPRLGNLNELLSAESTQDGWLSSLSWRVRTTIPKVVDKQQMPETPVLKPVNLNGQSSFLLVQAIRPSSNQSTRLFYVAGLISQKTLQWQAMHIPTAWIVLLTLPVVLDEPSSGAASITAARTGSTCDQCSSSSIVLGGL